MYTCAYCKIHACCMEDRNGGNYPKNCPMQDAAYMEEIDKRYSDPEVKDFYIATKTPGPAGSSRTFTPRLRGVIDLCKQMKYKKIGLAFCYGFTKEAEMYAKILKNFGFDVVSVCCLNGGFNIADRGVALPEGCEFDAACNPLGQAELMNRENVDFNLVMGLCAGHDSLFMKYAKAMSSVIVVKDPATGHCPVAALYLFDPYYKRVFTPTEEDGKKE